MSSPGFPPSSGPVGGTPNSSLPQSRPIVDPLAFDNVRGLGGSQDNGDRDGSMDVDETATGRGPRRGARRARVDGDDIPRVKDATGEKVMESFALFLEK